MNNNEIYLQELYVLGNMLRQGDDRITVYSINPRTGQPIIQHKKKADIFDTLLLVLTINDRLIQQGFVSGKSLQNSEIFVTEIWLKQVGINQAIIYLLTKNNEIHKLPTEDINLSFKLFAYNYSFYHLCVWDNVTKGNAMSLMTEGDTVGCYFSSLVFPFLNIPIEYEMNPKKEDKAHEKG